MNGRCRTIIPVLVSVSLTEKRFPLQSSELTRLAVAYRHPF